jgi:hypothetical protein
MVYITKIRIFLRVTPQNLIVVNQFSQFMLGSLTPNSILFVIASIGPKAKSKAIVTVV